MFYGKKILIGISGGIAAYKTCEIIRELKKNRAQCRVIMTKAAQEFVTALSFETLSEAPVLCELFTKQRATGTIHIEIARWADVLIICPATANVIGKIANGIADDLLSTTVMATVSPVIICPAMNREMYKNPIVQQNIEKLQKLGYMIISPETGSLACGEEGIGRLADKGTILDIIKKAVLSTDELKGKRILVTAGRTEEALDPVRILTNYASGKMGFALAEIAALHSAEVMLISGPNDLTAFTGVRLKRIRSAEQMAHEVLRNIDSFDIVIMAAAVADYCPSHISEHKIKKNNSIRTIQLQPTVDILKKVGARKGEKFIVGFAVETTNEIANAQKKMLDKNLDLIVLNNPLKPGVGFGVDTNAVTVLHRSGSIKEIPLDSKRNIAIKIIDEIITQLKTGQNSSSELLEKV